MWQNSIQKTTALTTLKKWGWTLELRNDKSYYKPGDVINHDMTGLRLRQTDIICGHLYHRYSDFNLTTR